MRLITSVFAALAASTAPVLANIFDFGVPAVIKPGEAFDARFHYAIQQPSQYTIVWGYTPFDNETEPAYLPQHNNVGLDLATVYLPDLDFGYNGTVPNLKIDGDVGDQVGIHALVWSQSGVVNLVSIYSYIWNVTLGEATSSDDYIFIQSSEGNPGFHIFRL